MTELDHVVIGAPDAPCDGGFGVAVYALLESHQRVLVMGAEYRRATQDRRAAMRWLQRLGIDNKRIAGLIGVCPGAVWKATSEPKKKKAKGNGK